MSNRRRAKISVPLQPAELRLDDAPPPDRIHGIEWSDDPPAKYSQPVMAWIGTKLEEAGRLNAWTCEVCKTPFIAYDRHPGTTPFTVAHQTFDPDDDCEGACVSGFYSSAAVYAAAKWHGQQQVTPSHEWYRPSQDELAGYATKRDRGVVEHVHQGGLLVRRITA